MTTHIHTYTHTLLPCLPALLLCACAGSQPSGGSAGVRAVTAPAAPRPAATSTAYNAARPIAGIPNFHVVHPSLLRGAVPSDEGLESLKAAGVRTVIDLRISPHKVAREQQEVESLGMKFINLPMSDEPPTKKQVQSFLQAATSPSSQPVFVHCQHGADRTGTMVGIYREQVDHWPFDQAYSEMLRYGFKPYYTKLSGSVRQYQKG